MKKLCAILLASMMAFTPVLAEEEVEVIHWEDYEELTKEEGLEGDFFSIENTGLKIYMPEAFTEVEVTDEDKESGMVAAFIGPGVNEDGAEGVMSVVISSIDIEGATLEALAEGIEADDIEWAEVNGMSAFSFVDAKDEYPLYYAWTDNGKGKAVMVMFMPIFSEENATKSLFMFYSLQADEAGQKDK